MPNIGMVDRTPAFRGLLNTVQVPTISLPRGFDAVAQCGQELLSVQLVRNLAGAGLETMRAKIPYDTGGLPAEVVHAIAPHISLTDVTSAAIETAIELRLSSPQLRTIGRPVSPGTGPTVVTLEPLFGADDMPAAIVWTLELNLLRIESELVVAPERSAAPSPGEVRVGDLVFGVPDLQQPLSDPRERRTLIASGQVVMRVPTLVASRAELLLAWVELDTARTATEVIANDSPLAALMQTQRGQDLLRTALWPLTSRGRLRLSPQIALGGMLAPQYVATMGLGEMQVRRKVHVQPNGREVLSLAFTFGEDAGGALSELQSFTGQHNFAFHVTRDVMNAVVRARWTLRPADHEFVGEGQVEMPLHRGTEQTGQGTVRVRVRLGAQLTDVGIMAALGPDGDVLRLGSDQEVQILAAWYANGDPVEDLGELGEAATVPFVVNIAPFTPAPPTEAVNTQFRQFLLTVLEPLALPMIERFRIGSLKGFLSEALGSSTAWWSFPTLTQEVTPGSHPSEVAFQ